MAFQEAGCHVEAVCPSRHPFETTDKAQKIHTYRALAPLRSFRKAIHAANPDLIVPCDDLAAEHLHQLHALAKATSDAQLQDLIERSLGCPSSYPLAHVRAGLMNLAHEEGVRVPETLAISTEDELREWLEQQQFPVVLKANATWGGVGVRFADSAEPALRAYRELQSPPSAARVAKRALVDRDLTSIAPFFNRNRHHVTAQKFIPGRDATSTVACWQGQVLAEISLAVLEKEGLTGPSTIVRSISNGDISAFNKRIVRRLGLSGFYGFDYMIDERTGNPYLVEMNPRATPTSHLPLGPGRDLVTALAGALQGRRIAERTPIPRSESIALFPYALEHNPLSNFLNSAYHDIPWGELRFILACFDSLGEGKWWSYKNWMKTRPGVRLRQIALGERPAERPARRFRRRKRAVVSVEIRNAAEDVPRAEAEQSRAVS